LGYSGLRAIHFPPKLVRFITLESLASEDDGRILGLAQPVEPQTELMLVRPPREMIQPYQFGSAFHDFAGNDVAPTLNPSTNFSLGFEDGNLIPHALKFVCSREAGKPCTDHDHVKRRSWLSDNCEAVL
jgi:hypothetical protein